MGGEVLLLRTVRLASHTLEGLPVSGGLAFFTDSERERGEHLFDRSVEIPRIEIRPRYVLTVNI